MSFIEIDASASTASLASVPKQALFALGKVAITRGALPFLLSGEISAASVLARHQCGDWGDLCESDKRVNDRALVSGNRILSAYRVEENGRLWVITESDRSVTTILVPSEY